MSLEEGYDLRVRYLRELPVPFTNREEHRRDERTDEVIDQGPKVFHSLSGRYTHREHQTTRPLEADGLDRAAHGAARGHTVVHQDHRTVVEDRWGPSAAQLAGEPVDLLRLGADLGVELFGGQAELTHPVPVHVPDPTFGDGP